MNVFQLVLKQMRQRALGTWLTLLSVLLAVGLAIAIMIARREAGALFGQTEYGYDVLVGLKGSPLQLVTNTIYHIDKSPGNIPYKQYEEVAHSPKFGFYVKSAVPFAVGDSYQGLRIFATTPKFFGFDDSGKALAEPFEYRPGKHFEFEQGHVFAPNRLEAIIGSDVSRLTGLKLGDKFKATHGMPAANEIPDIHPVEWTVAGVLKPSRTANDRVLFISLQSFYTIAEHEEGLKAISGIKQGKDIADTVAPTTAKADDHGHDHDHGEDEDKPKLTMNPDGTFTPTLPKEEWEVSGIMVKSRGPFQAQGLMYLFANNGGNVMAVNPASTMREFFQTFLKGSSLLLLAIASLVTVVAAAGILVSIYNSVAARLKEIAILRALGATRTRVLFLICLEAGLIGLFGGLLGLLAGHLLAGIGSVFFERFLGQGINWIATDPYEWYYVGAVVVLAVLAGLVPALKAYRTPVATNLVAS